MSRPGVATSTSKGPAMLRRAISMVVPPSTERTRSRVAWVKRLNTLVTCSPRSREGTMTAARGRAVTVRASPAPSSDLSACKMGSA